MPAPNFWVTRELGSVLCSGLSRGTGNHSVNRYVGRIEEIYRGVCGLRPTVGDRTEGRPFGPLRPD